VSTKRFGEAITRLCEPVEPPKGDLRHIHNFCGNTEIPDELKQHAPQRTALYESTVAFVRAYADSADDLPLAG
jgi:type I restriction enzyme R subunit